MLPLHDGYAGLNFSNFKHIILFRLAAQKLCQIHRSGTRRSVPQPIKAILKWFDSQPPEIQETVAFLVLMLLPGVQRPDIEEGRFIEVLRRWLDDSRNAGNLQVVGRCVAFRALLDFVCKRNFTASGWEESAEITDRIKTAAEEEHPEWVEDFEDQTRRIPFRKAQWMKAGTSWAELCSGPLSDEALELFSHGLGDDRQD